MQVIEQMWCSLTKRSNMHPKTTFLIYNLSYQVLIENKKGQKNGPFFGEHVTTLCQITPQTQLFSGPEG